MFPKKSRLVLKKNLPYFCWILMVLIQCRQFCIISTLAQQKAASVSLTNRLSHPRIYATIKNSLQQFENEHRGGGTWAPNILVDGRCRQAWKHGFAPTIEQALVWISSKEKNCVPQVTFSDASSSLLECFKFSHMFMAAVANSAKTLIRWL